jgi:hypothetical protein
VPNQSPQTACGSERALKNLCFLRFTGPMSALSAHRERLSTGAGMPSAHQEQTFGTSGTPVSAHQEQTFGTSGTPGLRKLLFSMAIMSVRQALTL